MKTRLTVSVALILMLIVGCAKKNDPIVATVGDKTVITLQEFNNSFAGRRTEKQIENATIEDKEKHLDRLISDRLLVLKAYDLNYNEDSTVIARTKRTKEKYITDALYQEKIIDKLIQEKDLEEHYNKLKKDVVARFIFFECAMDASEEEEKRVRERAEDALARIKKGEPFPRIARDVSEDKKTAASGGLVGKVKWKANGSIFIQKSFEMEENEVSEVFRSEKGFNIIKIDEIINLDVKPYEQMKRFLMDDLKRAKEQVIADKAKAFVDKLIQQRKLTYNEDALDRLTGLMGGLESDLSEVVFDRIETFPDSILDIVVAQYDNGEVRIKDILEKRKEVPPNAHMNFTEAWGIKYGIERWYGAIFLVDEAFRLKMGETDHVKDRIRANLENVMVKEMLRREVYEKIEVNNEQIEAYYNENKEKRYSKPKRVKIQEVMVKDRILAENIKEWIQGGRDMGELAEKYTIRRGYDKNKGITNYFPQSLWGEVGKKAHSMKVGELAGPIKDASDKGYSVIRLLDIREAKLEKLSHVRGQVRKDCFFDMRKTKKAEYIEQLKKEFQVKKTIEALKD